MNPVKYLYNEFMKEKQFFKNSFLVFFSGIIGGIIVFIANIFLANIFGVEDYGSFKLMLYFAAIITSLLDFGAAYAVSKYIAEFKVKSKLKIPYLLRWFLKLRFVTYAIVIAGLLVFKDSIAGIFLHNPSLAYLMIPVIIMIAASFFNILTPIVTGYENFKLYSLSRLTVNITFSVLCIVFGYFFGIGYAIIGNALSIFIGNIICLESILKSGAFSDKFKKFNVKEIFWKYSLPIHIFYIPLALGNSITPILGLFFSGKAIGYYSFAFIFYISILLLPLSLGSVLFPQVSRLNSINRKDEARKTLKRVLLFYTFAVVGGTIGTLMFSDFIFSVAPFLQKYAPGITIFKVLVIFGLFAGYTTILSTYYAAKEKVKKVALVNLAQNLLLFVVSFIVLKMMY